MVWLPKCIEFLAGLPEGKRKQRLLMAVQVYVDESGGAGQEPVFVLAGVMGYAERWAQFSDEWQAVLDEEPKIHALKMHQAVHMRGDFRGWPIQARNERLSRLADVLNKRELAIIECNMNLAGLRETVPEGLKLFSDPYFISFHAMIMGVAYHLLELGHTEPFEIIFDENMISGPWRSSRPTMAVLPSGPTPLMAG